jgi:hypothetical protein
MLPVPTVDWANKSAEDSNIKPTEVTPTAIRPIDISPVNISPNQPRRLQSAGDFKFSIVNPSLTVFLVKFHSLRVFEFVCLNSLRHKLPPRFPRRFAVVAVRVRPIRLGMNP